MLGARTIGPRFLGAGRVLLAPAIPISGSGAAAATGIGTIGAGVLVSGAGSAAAAGSGSVLRRLGLSGVGTAAATGQVTFGIISVLSGAGQARATGQAIIGANRAVSGAGQAFGQGSSTIGLRRSITGSGISRGSGVAVIGARRPLSGAGLAQAQGTGFTFNSKPVAGTGNAIATGIGSFISQFAGTFASGRIILIPPRDPNLLIPARNPIIRIRVDDEGITVLQAKEKQPSEVVDYIIPMREWFKKVDPTDYISIADSTVTVTPTGDPEDLVAGPTLPFVKPAIETADGLEPKIARIWLGKGRDGIEYKVTIKIQTNQGRVEEADLPVFVLET